MKLRLAVIEYRIWDNVGEFVRAAYDTSIGVLGIPAEADLGSARRVFFVSTGVKGATSSW